MQLLLTLLGCLTFFNPSSASAPFSDVRLTSTNENGGQFGLVDRQHELECFAENGSARPMMFVWKIDGKQIAPRRGRYTMLRYNSTETSGFSILKIRKIKRTDAALYTCKVVNDMGSVESELNLSVASLPEKPQWIRVVDKSASEIVLSWLTPQQKLPVQRYIIEFKQLSDPTWTTLSYAGDETTRRIANLEESAIYHIRVIAENQHGLSKPSEMIAVSTHQSQELIQPIHPVMPTELNASAIPTDFKCKTLHSKSIHLSWYLPSSGRYGNVVGYMALYAPSDQWIGLEESKEERALALLFKLDARPTEMVLDRLAPNTNYTIRIQPALRDGVGCKSQMVTCSTDQDLPGAPLLVTASLNDSTTILVRWRPPSLTNGHVKQYTVYIKKGWEEPVIKQVTWWDDGEYLQYAHDIENADESSNRKERYKIWVTASTIYGEGKASAAVIFKTAAKRPQGVAGRNSTLPAEYFPRSDQLNQVIDDVLRVYSNSLLFTRPFHTRIESISAHLETEPWAYLAKPPPPRGAVSSNWLTSLLSRFLPDEADDDEDVTDEEQMVDEEVDQEEEDAEELMDAEDQDDENDGESGAQNATETDLWSVIEKKNNGFVFSATQPSETPDNKFELNFRLLAENELTLPQVQQIAITERNDEENTSERTTRKFKGKFRGNSKRLNAKVGGFQNLKRSGDVMVKKIINDTKVLQIPIQIGPIRYTMKAMADFELRNVTVTSPVLTARLRLVERDGSIVHALIKPKKVDKSWMIVTYTSDRLPSQVQCGRLVTHSSRQMAKMWNSGLFLRRIGRDLKQFLKYQQLTPKLMDISDVESIESFQ